MLSPYCLPQHEADYDSSVSLTSPSQLLGRKPRRKRWLQIKKIPLNPRLVEKALRLSSDQFFILYKCCYIFIISVETKRYNLHSSHWKEQSKECIVARWWPNHCAQDRVQRFEARVQVPSSEKDPNEACATKSFHSLNTEDMKVFPAPRSHWKGRIKKFQTWP